MFQVGVEALIAVSMDLPMILRREGLLQVFCSAGMPNKAQRTVQTSTFLCLKKMQTQDYMQLFWATMELLNIPMEEPVGLTLREWSISQFVLLVDQETFQQLQEYTVVQILEDCVTWELSNSNLISRVLLIMQPHRVIRPYVGHLTM